MEGGIEGGIEGGAERRRRQRWAARPLRVIALGRAYGLAGLLAHGLGKLQRNHSEVHQLWQGPPAERQGGGVEAAGLGEGIAAVSAAELRTHIAELLPFKRGIAGLVRQLADRPGQVLAVAALQGPQLRGLAMATRHAAGLWVVHDVFVFPGERRAGLGRGLVEAINALVRRSEPPGRAVTLWAEILPYNRASQAVFRQCGWREVAVTQRRMGRQGPTL